MIPGGVREVHPSSACRRVLASPAVASAAVLLIINAAVLPADEVLTTSGELVKGSIKIEAGGVSVAGRPIPLRDVIVARLAQSARFSKMGQGIVTVGGDIISGSVSDLENGKVRIASDLFGPMKVGKEEVRLVTLRATSIASLTCFSREFEGVLLGNDDSAEGEITWMSEDEIGVKTRAGIFRIPRKRARIVSFGTKGKKAAGARRLRARMVNGDLVAVSNPKLDAKAFSFTGGLGRDLRVGREMLYEIFSTGGRIVHLSDLAPTRAEHVPQFDADFPHRKDSSVSGGMLRVGDRSYPRGFGVHSKSVLEFDVGGKYSMILTEIGVDEEVGERGSVVFRIKVDGRVAYESETTTGRSGPRRAQANLAGCKKLTLEVDYGPDGADAGDHADWCMPVLIRK